MLMTRLFCQLVFGRFQLREVSQSSAPCVTTSPDDFARIYNIFVLPIVCPPRRPFARIYFPYRISARNPVRPSCARAIVVRLVDVCVTMKRNPDEGRAGGDRRMRPWGKWEAEKCRLRRGGSTILPVCVASRAITASVHFRF